MSKTTQIIIYVVIALTTITAQADFVFPTKNRPSHSYLESPRRFSANRSGGRLHAACDLYRPNIGEEAVSVTTGKVVRDLYYFYQGTYALEVKHPHFIARYGEITGKRAPRIGAGAKLKAGQTLGYIAKVNSNCCSPMLHFEMYTGSAKGSLTQRSGKYQRRSDLQNPTEHLQEWEVSQFGNTFVMPTFEYEEPVTRTQGKLTSQAPRVDHPMHSLLAQLQSLVKQDNSIEQLETLLKSYELNPHVISNHNEDTGKMVIVESFNENQNLRNVRAQYFYDESGQAFLQHLSFEMRPTRLGLSKTLNVIQDVLPELGQPEMKTYDFQQWSLPQGYVLWVKQMQMADLEGNPFHQYTASDRGTIRVAIELEPHIEE